MAGIIYVPVHCPGFTGVQLADILRVAIPAGYFLPVTPGTKFVTLGGAVASGWSGPRRVKAGAVVCIKQLSTTPDVTNRLRELGFCEEQKIRLVARQSNYICQVCNARLAISGKLAESIMVQTVSAPVAED